MASEFAAPLRGFASENVLDPDVVPEFESPENFSEVVTGDTRIGYMVVDDETTGDTAVGDTVEGYDLEEIGGTVMGYVEFGAWDSTFLPPITPKPNNRPKVSPSKANNPSKAHKRFEH